MANKKYTDVSPGTAYTDSVILIANPNTGALSSVTVAALLAASGTTPGGGGGGGATPLSTPTLTATVISSSQIDLSWTNVANESSYRLEWSPNGSTGWTQIGGTIAANTTTYSHTSLTASTLYYYRVKAVGDGVTYSDSGYGTDSDTTSASGGGFDTDAQAFFTAANITDTTQQNAVNTFVVAAKANGYWTKLKALYPMVGATATKHSYNLKNPATFQVTWSGTMTHNATGSRSDDQGGGAGDGYGNTGFNPFTQLTANSASCGFYCQTNLDNGNQWTIGGYQASGTKAFVIQDRNSNTGKVILGSEAINASGTVTNSQGFFVGSRTADNSLKFYRNGSQVGSTATTANTIDFPNLNLRLFGMNSDGTNTQNDYGKFYSLFFIGDGLTDSDVSNMYTDVQAMQTALSRAV